MQKLFIQNRKGQKVAVVVEQAVPQKGLVFVMHGLGGFKEQPQTRAVAEELVERGYTAVTFDTTNTFGESDGRYEDATTTNYYEDLEDVIAWAKESSSATKRRLPPLSGGGQPLYQEPLVLIGFSLGGLCVALYAQRHPEKVKGLALIGTVVSGALSITGHAPHEEWRKWKETGWRETPSESKPGLIKRLPWSHMEDRLKYDLLPEAYKLTMPVLLVVGEKDESCPPEHQKILYAALPGSKELHIIPGAPHTLREHKHLEKLKQIFNDWLVRIEQKVP